MAKAMARWDPFQQLARLQQDLDSMFGRFGQRQDAQGIGWLPPADVEETEDQIIFRLDLPGIDPEKVSVDVHERTLTIAGERREEREEKHEGFVTRERRYGSFSRSFLLPEGIDEGEISAECKNGVLLVSMPRPAGSKPHSIEVKST